MGEGIGEGLSQDDQLREEALPADFKILQNKMSSIELAPSTGIGLRDCREQPDEMERLGTGVEGLPEDKEQVASVTSAAVASDREDPQSQQEVEIEAEANGQVNDLGELSAEPESSRQDVVTEASTVGAEPREETYESSSHVEFSSKDEVVAPLIPPHRGATPNVVVNTPTTTADRVQQEPAEPSPVPMLLKFLKILDDLVLSKIPDRAVSVNTALSMLSARLSSGDLPNDFPATVKALLLNCLGSANSYIIYKEAKAIMEKLILQKEAMNSQLLSFITSMPEIHTQPHVRAELENLGLHNFGAQYMSVLARHLNEEQLSRVSYRIKESEFCKPSSSNTSVEPTFSSPITRGIAMPSFHSLGMSPTVQASPRNAGWGAGSVGYQQSPPMAPHGHTSSPRNVAGMHVGSNVSGGVNTRMINTHTQMITNFLKVIHACAVPHISPEYHDMFRQSFGDLHTKICLGGEPMNYFLPECRATLVQFLPEYIVKFILEDSIKKCPQIASECLLALSPQPSPRHAHHGMPAPPTYNSPHRATSGTYAPTQPPQQQQHMQYQHQVEAPARLSSQQLERVRVYMQTVLTEFRAWSGELLLPPHVCAAVEAQLQRLYDEVAKLPNVYIPAEECGHIFEVYIKDFRILREILVRGMDALAQLAAGELTGGLREEPRRSVRGCRGSGRTKQALRQNVVGQPRYVDELAMNRETNVYSPQPQPVGYGAYNNNNNKTVVRNAGYDNAGYGTGAPAPVGGPAPGPWNNGINNPMSMGINTNINMNMNMQQQPTQQQNSMYNNNNVHATNRTDAGYDRGAPTAMYNTVNTMNTRTTDPGAYNRIENTHTGSMYNTYENTHGGGIVNNTNNINNAPVNNVVQQQQRQQKPEDLSSTCSLYATGIPESVTQEFFSQTFSGYFVRVGGRVGVLNTPDMATGLCSCTVYFSDGMDANLALSFIPPIVEELGEDWKQFKLSFA